MALRKNQAIMKNHFAIGVTEVHFTRKYNKKISIVLEKGIQIIGEINCHLQGGEKDAKKLLNLQENTLYFMIRDDKNLQYSWTLYNIHDDGNQEFVENKKFSISPYWNLYKKNQEKYQFKQNIKVEFNSTKIIVLFTLFIENQKQLLKKMIQKVIKRALDGSKLLENSRVIGKAQSQINAENIKISQEDIIKEIKEKEQQTQNIQKNKEEILKYKFSQQNENDEQNPFNKPFDLSFTDQKDQNQVQASENKIEIKVIPDLRQKNQEQRQFQEQNQVKQQKQFKKEIIYQQKSEFKSQVREQNQKNEQELCAILQIEEGQEQLNQNHENYDGLKYQCEQIPRNQQEFKQLIGQQEGPSLIRQDIQNQENTRRKLKTQSKKFKQPLKNYSQKMEERKHSRGSKIMIILILIILVVIIGLSFFNGNKIKNKPKNKIKH